MVRDGLVNQIMRDIKGQDDKWRKSPDHKMLFDVQMVMTEYIHSGEEFDKIGHEKNTVRLSMKQKTFLKLKNET